MDTVAAIVIENVGSGTSSTCNFEVDYTNGSYRCVEVCYHVKTIDDINQVLFDIGDDMIAEDFQHITFN